MVFAYSTMSIMVLLAVFVPKKISIIEIYSTFFFAYWLGITVDLILDLKYNLYGYVAHGVQYTSIIFITAAYFSVSTLFLNYFPSNKSILTKLLYIVCWSIFSVIYETLLILTHFFYYSGWKWWYSGLLYPLIFTILRLNLFVVQRLLALYLKHKGKEVRHSSPKHSD